MLDEKLLEKFETKPKLVALELQHEVEQFLYWESKLLTDRRYQDWFSLLSSDIHYWMPIRSTKIMREVAQEYTDEQGFAHFDDNWHTMKGRIRKIISDVGWSENPASRLRYIVSNVMVAPESDTSLYVNSAMIVYRTRQERQLDIFACERRDLIRRVDTEAGFELARRRIVIDQSTILSNNLSFFF
ncbi:3-phenylpropionate/cinnamic acid dioxygenase subunit beta [Sphingomonas sp. Ant20]|uniref:aromatic-ring-hydroxylating dioxygenase subunit beta n=1 Tax=Sphingomonas sp. Ant20 TaxID=104605 RepID=UPI0005388781|nr:3-phenylpropionate/cinnamic acid dioxygenase subunit beta [Sphingomonas sp. Ant20]KHA64553.1 benzene 1,2-dioxygenase [Sphingomonas sp. Ant20]